MATGGRTVSVLHPSQLGPLLGLRLGAGYDAARLAWDLLGVLDDWITLAGELDFAAARLPTPARQRSTCDLVANVFPPIALLPEAWASSRFIWPADHEEQNRIDAEISRRFADSRAMAAFAAAHTSPFRDFVLETFSGPAEDINDPTVTTPNRGTVSFSTLLAAQRWHAALHLLQSITFLDRAGHPHPLTPSLTSIHDLGLPEDPY